MTYRLLFAIFFFLLFPIVLSAQNSNKYTLSSDTTVNRLAGEMRVYEAIRISKRPKIDGRLNDDCWSQGIWAGNFIQQVPLQGKQPSQETLVKVLYDNNNIYVGFKCFDKDPKGIRPILSRRDESVGDAVGIAFDSYHDKRTAYEFDIDASGQKIDMVHLGAYSFDYNWDAVWNGKTFVDDSVWYAEMQIPFSQIHFSPGEEQVWGMHVWRWIDRFQEESQWKLIPIDAPAMVYLFGELHGIEGVKPKTNYEFLPYVSTRFKPNTDLKDKWTQGIGLDGKIGLNSGFTLNYAVNPDFGQVEADPSVLNLTSYEVFYDEKRPFFLEGNTILDYSIGSDMLYYSRRIGHDPSFYPDLSDNQTIAIADNVPILSAIKLTGKTPKGLSVGVVQSITAKENATIYDENSKSKIAVEPFTNFTVGRIKQDFNNGNTVLGGMITSTIRDIQDDQLKFLPASSLVGGLDFQHNWKKRKYFVDFKGFFSNIKGDTTAIQKLQLSSVHYYQRTDAGYLDYDPERNSLSGNGGMLQGGKRSGRFRAIGTFNWRSPGVDFNDVGYLYQADLISEVANLTYKVSAQKGNIRSYFVEFEQEHDWNFGGDNTLDRLNLHGYLQLKNLWSAHLNTKRYYNIFDTRELRGGPGLRKDNYYDAELFIQSNQVKDLMVAFGPRYKFFSDDISKTDRYTFYLRWQISDRFSVVSQTVYDHSIDNNKWVTKTTNSLGQTDYIVGTIDRNTISSTLRFEYFISPEISIQYYGNPYASVGSYSNFRTVADASNRVLTERYASLDLVPNGKYLQSSVKTIAPSITIRNPDFNYQEFRSNLVGRWEFRPGSTLYLVWTNTRSAYSDKLDQSVWQSFGSIMGGKSQNVFMIKFSYWFSL